MLWRQLDVLLLEEEVNAISLVITILSTIGHRKAKVHHEGQGQSSQFKTTSRSFWGHSEVICRSRGHGRSSYNCGCKSESLPLNECTGPDNDSIRPGWTSMAHESPITILWLVKQGYWPRLTSNSSPHTPVICREAQPPSQGYGFPGTPLYTVEV